MGKYNDIKSPIGSNAVRIHPVWRGIGFIFMTLTPILAFFLTTLLLTMNTTSKWFTIPRSLLANGSDPYLYVKILGTVVIVFIVYIIFMMITFFTYRAFGPSRVGPMDAPQSAFHGKAHRR